MQDRIFNGDEDGLLVCAFLRALHDHNSGLISMLCQSQNFKAVDNFLMVYVVEVLLVDKLLPLHTSRINLLRVKC